MTHVYTRECHENKNTRFWATYDHRENDEPEDGGVMSNDKPIMSFSLISEVHISFKSRKRVPVSTTKNKRRL